MSIALHKRNVRDALKPRREPYWAAPLEPGRFIGFRVIDGKPGSWIARARSDDGGQKYNALKDANDYDAACKDARKWFAGLDAGVVRSDTVENVCKLYVADRKTQKGERAARFCQQPLKKHVYGKPIGARKIDQLKTAEIKRWRDGLLHGEQKLKPKNKKEEQNPRIKKFTRRRNSVNRIWRQFLAAMNYAFDSGMIASRIEWERVKPLSGEGSNDEQRTAYLTVQQRQALLAKCKPALADFLRALLHTAARPNEMQAVTVGDFDARQGTVRLVSYKGRSGEPKVRFVDLSPSAVTFFKEQARSKLPAAPLLDLNGKRWRRDEWADGIKAAVKAANAEIPEPENRLPLDVVAYTCRHCAIVDNLQAGVLATDVVKRAGTSLVMLEKHYSKYLAGPVKEKLANITAF